MELADTKPGTVIPTVLFTVELYNTLAHFLILGRIRLLPRKDMVRLHNYFLFELLAVMCSALYTLELLWLATLQNLQHLYFYVTWNKTAYCRRVSSDVT